METGAGVVIAMKTKTILISTALLLLSSFPVWANNGESEAQALLEQARVAAAADQHEAAIAFYLDAIRAHPSTATSVGVELGNQYTWAEQPDSAIAWYRRHIENHPADMDAHLGLARALSWGDQLDESLAHYRKILPDSGEREAEVRAGIARITAWKDQLARARVLYDQMLNDHPDNRDAKLGRAQVINWSGRHREAANMYRSMMDEMSGSHEVYGGLANAYRWMGRPDLALEVLRGAPEHPSLNAIADEIHHGRAARVIYSYTDSEDSDDVEHRGSSTHVITTPQHLTRVDASYTTTNITQSGLPKVDRDQIQVSLVHRFSDALAATVTPGYQWNDFNAAALSPAEDFATEHDLFLWDAYLTVTPRDWARLDFGTYRGSLDNPLTTFRGIRITETSAGMDWRFTPTLMLVSSLKYTDFSDGNSRVTIGQQLRWSPPYRAPLPWRLRFTADTGYAYLNFSETLDNGYYNPEQYFSMFEILGTSIQFTPRIELNLSGRLALEQENGSDWFGVSTLSGSLGLRMARNFWVTTGYHNSRSRLDTKSGYYRSGFYVTAGYVIAPGHSK